MTGAWQGMASGFCDRCCVLIWGGEAVAVFPCIVLCMRLWHGFLLPLVYLGVDGCLQHSNSATV